jgi:Zn-dependent protease
MFNEPALTTHEPKLNPPQPPQASQQPAAPANPHLEAVRALVQRVMDIEHEITPDDLRPDDIRGGLLMLMIPDASLLMRFDGQLLIDSETAYDQLDAECLPLNLTPVLREAADGRVSTYIVEGRSKPRRTGWLWNAILLLATLVSVLYVGRGLGFNEQFAGLMETNPREALAMLERFQDAPWYADLHLGIPYAFGILLILGAHELGHYFAARRRKHAASLPFFIPFPFGIFGTFGAFIQLRQPMRNRRTLLEIGAAGPLAGLVFAIPILLIGLATSPVGQTSGGLTEGNSIFYALAKLLVFGRFLPSGGEDVFVNSLAWAGWTGLFVTGLNLLPVGQLDGGHVLYSLLGERAKQVYWPTMFVVGALTLLTGGSLIFIFVLLLMMGRVHAVPLDNLTPLGTRHRAVAIATLIIFVLVFVPVPFTVGGDSGALSLGAGEASAAVFAACVIALSQRLRR